jgi:DNA-directed RNA polymerase specialized sigma24 family protein
LSHAWPRARYQEVVERSPDSALVDRLRRGDRAAFRELYARFAQPTFRFLARLTGRRDAAEDLHQDTWLRVARHHDRLRPDSDLAAWIFAIARNAFVSSRRRAEPLDRAGGGLPSEVVGGTTVPDADPGCHDLERALAQLPEPHREILLLVGVEGLEIAQAATVLELRADAVRQRLLRARAALAAALDATPIALVADEALRTPRKGRGR